MPELVNIHDRIDAWHEGPPAGSDLDDMPLHTYLGMSWEQYAAWVTLQMPEEELAALGFKEDDEDEDLCPHGNEIYLGAWPQCCDWRCECGDLNRRQEAFCYRCGAVQPEEPEGS